MLGGDGASLHLAALEGPLLRVRYVPGDCADCTLAPDDLVGMMQEMLARRGSAINRVEVTNGPQAPSPRARF
jgi:hypothetical protein